MQATLCSFSPEERKRHGGAVSQWVFEPPQKWWKPFRWKNCHHDFTPLSAQPWGRKSPSEHQKGDSRDDKDCVPSAVHLHAKHRAVASFRRRLEAGWQQTPMHSSTCSCCSFHNASLQFIASCLIWFALSSILWPLNYVDTDWSWGTTGVMLALPKCCTKHSCRSTSGGDHADTRE